MSEFVGAAEPINSHSRSKNRLILFCSVLGIGATLAAIGGMFYLVATTKDGFEVERQGNQTIEIHGENYSEGLEFVDENCDVRSADKIDNLVSMVVVVENTDCLQWNDSDRAIISQ